MPRARRSYDDQTHCANWMVSIWLDAIALCYTQTQVLNCMARVYSSPQWKRLPQYRRKYCHGYADCYREQVVDRQFLESGSWVTMPDGSAQWFGVREQLRYSTRELEAQTGIDSIHRYTYEHSIPGRAGIYWVAETHNESYRGLRSAIASGEKPYFIPSLDAVDADKVMAKERERYAAR